MGIGASLSMRMEMESSQTDFKYFFETASQLNSEPELKQRLINCLLINRHYVLVLEKKSLDFTDYT